MACGDSSSSLTFAYVIVYAWIDAAFREGLDGPPVGEFLVDLYADGDASEDGPDPGAEPILSWSSESVELDGLGRRVGSIDSMAPQTVWAVGCLDMDGGGCGCGDLTYPPTSAVLRGSWYNDLDLTIDSTTICD